MKIVKMNEVPKVTRNTSLFTGPVSSQPLVDDSKELRISIVSFGKGIKNKFHKHEADQVLIVTAGKGIVATGEEERVVEVGDLIIFPAGEKHWHGATQDSEFSHLVVTRAGSKTTQLED
ncbi:MAG: cupin domain-containing protein [Planctomycetaceae bacterium]